MSLFRLRCPGVGASYLVNPAHAEVLHQAGITCAEDILALPEAIVSGHPDRHVSRVRIGSLRAFLKKEHRVPWKERLLSFQAGLGPVSKSLREARTLHRLTAITDAIPEWIAAGETEDGRGFLLLAELNDTLPLPQSLHGLPGDHRRRLARELARELSRLHHSGVQHGDLFAPHVRVQRDSLRVFLLDWQRTTCGGPPRPGWRDLAALSLTLGEKLVGPRERLRFLVTYLRHWPKMQRPGLVDAIQTLERIQRRLGERRHVRAKALHEADTASARLICLQGDTLRVTPAFLELWPSELPAFLREPGGRVADQELDLPGGGLGRLTRRIYSLRWHRRRGTARRTWTSPERLRSNLLFRLERFGVPVPRVLVVGERPLDEARIEATLLTLGPARAEALVNGMRQAGKARRRELLHQAGALLAQIHRAGCGCSHPDGFAVVLVEGQPRVVLADVARVFVRRGWRKAGQWLDRYRFRKWLRLEDPEESLALRQGYCAGGGSEERER